MTDDVEIDVYEPLSRDEEIDCYLGIDIGSTSTKATLMNRDKAVLVGLYARTGGQPISAVQKLTKAIAGLEERFSVRFRIHCRRNDRVGPQVHPKGCPGRLRGR